MIRELVENSSLKDSLLGLQYWVRDIYRAHSCDPGVSHERPILGNA
jgi:hypothetical protein